MQRGSCLCGGIVFEVEGELTPIQLCHATRCRKVTGSAFAPEVAAQQAEFHWLQGEDLLSTYLAPLLHEPPAYRHNFCRLCGSPMPALLEGTPFVILFAGTLDGEITTRPFRHVFVGQNAPWHTVSDDLPQFNEHVPETQRLPRH